MLWVQWWAMKWYFHEAAFPISSAVWLMESFTTWAVIGGHQGDPLGQLAGLGGRSARGTTLFTRPRRHASSASSSSPVEEELLGLADAQLPRLDQQLDAGSGHAQHGVGEPGVIGGHDEVAHAGQHEAGRHALPWTAAMVGLRKSWIFCTGRST